MPIRPPHQLRQSIAKNMNQTSTLLTILIFLSSCASTKKSGINKDSYKKSEIDSIVEWKYGYDLDSIELCDLYILDGTPYGSVDIDSVLTTLNKREIGFVTPIKPGKEQTWFHRQCDLFILLGTNNQSMAEKRKTLKAAKNLYNDQIIELKTTDYKCDKCPILSINGEIIQNPNDRKYHINKLTPQKLKYIVRISQKLNPEYYGTNYENGIIEITLK